MPHQCVRCNKFYEDGSSVILNGCGCGGKLFFFIKQERLEKARQIADEIKLSDEEKVQMESDIFEIIGKGDNTEPVVLDLEAIRILKPGQYELDIVHLFNKEPLIFKIEEGKYVIDIAESFKQQRKKKRF